MGIPFRYLLSASFVLLLGCGRFGFNALSPDDAAQTSTSPGPSCRDQRLNEDETDTDCGGLSCQACDDGQTCLVASDCISGVCTGMVCQVPACTDGVRNGNESKTDCGGSCSLCPPERCANGVQDEDEAGVDCGGSNCRACPVATPSFLGATEHAECGATSLVLEVGSSGGSVGDTLIVRLSARSLGGGLISAGDTQGNSYVLDAKAHHTTGAEAHVVVLRSKLNFALTPADQVTLSFPRSGAVGAVAHIFRGLADAPPHAVTQATGKDTTIDIALETTEPYIFMYGAATNANNSSDIPAAGWTDLATTAFGCGGATRDFDGRGAYAYIETVGPVRWQETQVRGSWAGVLIAYRTDSF